MSEIVLKFIFKTPLRNGCIEKILIRVAKEVGVELGLSEDLENLYAYVRASEEKIEEFSREVAKELPLSIFLKSVNAEVVDEFKDDLDRNFPEVSLPPCPKCLEEVKDENSKYYFDMFHHCEVCGYKVNGKLKIENGEFDFKKDRKKFFENLAKKLESENIVIQTMNGIYEISKNLENSEFVMARDLAVISKYFMAFEGDAKALASIEKPFITLKTNIEFKKTFGLSTPAFKVKLPDCMVTTLLFEAGEFELLGFKKQKKAIDLSFEVEVEKPLFAVVTDSKYKDILIEKGDRGIIPKFEKVINSDGKYKEYGYQNGVIDRLNKFKNLNTKEVNSVFAGFLGVLNQWELSEKNIMGFCFYEDENKILINSPKFGLVEYIDFKFAFNSFEEIFEEIALMNETGKKLIKNFKEKRNELFNHALNCDIKSEKRGIYYLWGLVGILLNLADNIDDGFKRILEYSKN